MSRFSASLALFLSLFSFSLFAATIVVDSNADVDPYICIWQPVLTNHSSGEYARYVTLYDYVYAQDFNTIINPGGSSAAYEYTNRVAYDGLSPDNDSSPYADPDDQLIYDNFREYFRLRNRLQSCDANAASVPADNSLATAKTVRFGAAAPINPVPVSPPLTGPSPAQDPLYGRCWQKSCAGSFVANNDSCTLREAIASANYFPLVDPDLDGSPVNTPSGNDGSPLDTDLEGGGTLFYEPAIGGCARGTDGIDTIVFSQAMTIVLDREIVIVDPVIIDGIDAPLNADGTVQDPLPDPVVIIKGDDANQTRLFYVKVDEGTTATFRDVLLENGLAEDDSGVIGDGTDVDEDLLLDDISPATHDGDSPATVVTQAPSVDFNTAGVASANLGDGGLVFNKQGTVVLDRVSMLGDTDGSPNSVAGDGGLVYIFDSIDTVADPNDTGNDPKNSLILSRVKMNGGKASINGGLIYSGTDVSLTIDDSDLVAGEAVSGGLIYTESGVNIKDSELRDAVFTNNGGAIYSTDGTVSITDSIIEDNKPTDVSVSTSSVGGALYMTDGTDTAASLTISRSSILRNGAYTTGGIHIAAIGSAVSGLLLNSTFSGNVSGHISGVGAGPGALFIANDKVTVNNVTMVGNTSYSAGVESGGIEIVDGSNAIVVNSIIAGNSSSTPANADCLIGGAQQIQISKTNYYSETVGCQDIRDADQEAAPNQDELNDDGVHTSGAFDLLGNPTSSLLPFNKSNESINATPPPADTVIRYYKPNGLAVAGTTVIASGTRGVAGQSCSLVDQLNATRSSTTCDVGSLEFQPAEGLDDEVIAISGGDVLIDVLANDLKDAQVQCPSPTLQPAEGNLLTLFPEAKCIYILRLPKYSTSFKEVFFNKNSVAKEEITYAQCVIAGGCNVKLLVTPQVWFHGFDSFVYKAYVDRSNESDSTSTYVTGTVDMNFQPSSGLAVEGTFFGSDGVGAFSLLTLIGLFFMVGMRRLFLSQTTRKKAFLNKNNNKFFRG